MEKTLKVGMFLKKKGDFYATGISVSWKFKIMADQDTVTIEKQGLYDIVSKYYPGPHKFKNNRSEITSYYNPFNLLTFTNPNDATTFTLSLSRVFSVDLVNQKVFIKFIMHPSNPEYAFDIKTPIHSGEALISAEEKAQLDILNLIKNNILIDDKYPMPQCEQCGGLKVINGNCTEADDVTDQDFICNYCLQVVNDYFERLTNAITEIAEPTEMIIQRPNLISIANIGKAFAIDMNDLKLQNFFDALIIQINYFSGSIEANAALNLLLRISRLSETNQYHDLNQYISTLRECILPTDTRLEPVKQIRLMEPTSEKNPKPPQSVKTALDKLRQIQNKIKTGPTKLPSASQVEAPAISKSSVPTVSSQAAPQAAPQVEPQIVKPNEPMDELPNLKEDEVKSLSASEKASILMEMAESEVVMTDSLKESIKALDDLMNEKPLIKEANKPVMQPVMSSKEPKIIVHSENIKKPVEQPQIEHNTIPLVPPKKPETPSLAPKELPPPTLKPPKLTAPVIVLPHSEVSDQPTSPPTNNQEVPTNSGMNAPIIFSEESGVQPETPQIVQDHHENQQPPKLDFVKPEDIPIEMLESSEEDNSNINQSPKIEVEFAPQVTHQDNPVTPVQDTIIKPVVKTKPSSQSLIPFLDMNPLTNIKPEIAKKPTVSENQSQNLLQPFLEQKKDFGFLTSRGSGDSTSKKPVVPENPSDSSTTANQINQVFNAQKKKTSTVICEFCGAVIMASQNTCPACGSPIKKK